MNKDIKSKKKNMKNPKKEISCALNFYKKEPTRLGISETIFLLVVTCIIGLISGYLLGTSKKVTNTNTKVIELDNNLSTFEETYKYILNNYYGEQEITKEQLINSAIDGMLNSLGDANSSYMDENTSSNFNITLEGSYQGLGVEVGNEVSTGNIVIISVFKDSPADKAGLLPGDKILKINGEDITTQTSSYFANYIKVSDNKEFDLLISRNKEEKEVKVIREKVILKSIVSKLIEKNNKKIGYIYISIFANNTYEQFKEALKELESKNIDSLIIDVRDNSGGHMSSAKNILSLFLDSSKIVYQTQDKNGIKKTYSTGNKTVSYKIVLLGNQSSASSSEILIGGLKDNLNAILVGEKTYGKGTVQELQTLPNGSQYKFTIKKWLTPNGTCIDKTGIEPDYKVQLSDEYLKNPSDETDNQLQKAIEILQ